MGEDEADFGSIFILGLGNDHKDAIKIPEIEKIEKIMKDPFSFEYQFLVVFERGMNGTQQVD